MLASVVRERGLLVTALLTALCIAATPSAQAGAQGAFCATGEPTSILSCLAQAYADRDLEAVRTLLSDDFQFIAGNEHNTWGLDQELRMHEKMFAAPGLEQLTLAIADGYSVNPGNEPATWVISSMSATLALDVVQNGEPKHYESTVSGQEFRVRQVLEPEAHFVIYRWWQPAYR
jgi:hypothetical protein